MSETQLFFIFWTDARNQISNSRYYIIPFLNNRLSLAKNPFVLAQFTRLLYYMRKPFEFAMTHKCLNNYRLYYKTHPILIRSTRYADTSNPQVQV